MTTLLFILLIILDNAIFIHGPLSQRIAVGHTVYMYFKCGEKHDHNDYINLVKYFL